jgi:glycosyltransferase involved in cell wall biosynthesis
MRLTMVLPAVGAGGAERVMTTLANAWATRGRQVHLLTFDDGSQPAFYPLHAAVTHEPLGLARQSRTLIQGLIRNVHRQRVLRAAVRRSQPDVVLSFLDQVNVITLLATEGLGLPVVVSERSDPRMKPIGRAAWTALRRWLYPRAGCVVVQTRGALAYFLPALRRSARVIPNPVLPPPALASPPGDRVGKLIVSLGRLSEEKQLDQLLHAFATVAGRRSEWRLEIWGDGPEREPLEKLRQRMGMADRIALRGATQDPYVVLREADLFALTSRYEGFPNALCEALACGVPAVSYACPSGPGEILRHGVDGLLVPAGDTTAFAAALAGLMDDLDRRRGMAAHAPEVVERFSLDRVLALWEDAFCVAAERAHRRR